MTQRMPESPVMKAMLAIAGTALVVMMIVVIADVILRAGFNHPVRGAYDVVSFALMVMVMFGMAPVVADRSEILIDLIDHMLPAAAIRVLALVSALSGVGLFAFCGWAMLTPAMDAWRYGDRSLELGVPIWALWALAFAGMAGIFFGYLLQLRTGLRPANDEEGAL